MLLPCTSCLRHVRQDESACPFCAAPLDFSQTPPHRLPRGRLGRAATFAFGATVVSATALASCGGKEERDEGESGGSAGMNAAGTMNVGGEMSVPVYGAPAPIAGTGPGGNGSGGTAGTDGNAGNSSGGATSNGGSGGMVDDGGGVQPLYGAVPAGGADGDGSGGGLPGPVYGAPP